MRFSIRIGACAALLVIAVAVVGCGETVLDSAKVQEAIKANLEKSLHRKVSSVSCPSEQKVEPKADFTCSISFTDGKQATATLKILNKEADVSVIKLQANK